MVLNANHAKPDDDKNGVASRINFARRGSKTGISALNILDVVHDQYGN